jgi:hypothetical protein
LSSTARSQIRWTCSIRRIRRWTSSGPINVRGYPP